MSVDDKPTLESLVCEAADNLMRYVTLTKQGKFLSFSDDYGCALDGLADAVARWKVAID